MSTPRFNIRDLLASATSSPNSAVPQVKSYSDAVYLNYFSLGLSLLFIPLSGYKPGPQLSLSELKSDNLALDSIDIYNIPKPTPLDLEAQSGSTRTAELAFSTYPVSPLVLTTVADVSEPGTVDSLRPPYLDVLSETSGKDFVKCLGEPDRKGGGAGPSSGSIGIWCEWTRDGIMVEFGGDRATGPQAWERGKDAIWKVITIFQPGQPAK